MPPFAEESQTVDDLDSTPKTGFTVGLFDTIALSKSKLNNWAEIQKAKIDEEAEIYSRKLELEQKAIDSLVANLLGVQLERGLNLGPESSTDDSHNENLSKRKSALQEEEKHLRIEIEKLKSEYADREKRVQDIKKEESKQRLRAQEARSLKERAQEAKRTTIDDLTRGIVNYKFLGLDFQKTDIENELRFSFSQLDPADPSRQFSFVLQVDKHDRYDVCDCYPSIDATVLIRITDHLNNTDDMGYLARTMRRSFLETL
eukprot:scaffold10871_cov177-Cylindrotheca_fusiformis.AAC.4